MDTARKRPDTAVKKLLASAGLPTADITPGHMEHFFGTWAGPSLERLSHNYNPINEQVV